MVATAPMPTPLHAPGFVPSHNTPPPLVRALQAFVYTARFTLQKLSGGPIPCKAPVPCNELSR